VPDDPHSLEDAYDQVVDALDFQSGATYEPAVEPSGTAAQIQLQKACRHLEACDLLHDEAFYGGVVELSFGAMERTLEGYMLAVLGNDLSDFQNHTDVYDRAETHGPISRQMARDLKMVYTE
jgi:hypothetical protein